VNKGAGDDSKLNRQNLRQGVSVFNLPFIVFIAALLPRVIALNAFLTPD